MSEKLIKPITIIFAILYGVAIIVLYPFFGHSSLMFSIVPLVLVVWFFNFKYSLIVFAIYLIEGFASIFIYETIDLPLLSVQYIIGNIFVFICIYYLSYFKQTIFYTKKSEENLLHFIVRNEEMISNISDVVAIIDSNGITTYKSENVLNHFGWKAKELVGKLAWDTVHPDDLEKVKENFNEILKTDLTTGSFEFRYQCKDGLYKNIVLTAKNLIGNPNIKGVLLNFHDISEIKKAGQELIESEYKFRKLFSNSIDAVCFLDNSNHIVDVNQACVNLFEYTREELLNMHVSEATHPDDKKKSESYFKTLEEKGFYEMYEGRIITKTGKIKWIEVNSTEYSKDGVKIGSQDIIRDITSFKNTQEKLEQLNYSKDKLLSIISHDLKNPFGTIIGFTELLQKHIDDKNYDNIEDFAGIIGETALQADKLLTNLLEWSKSQTGTLQFNPQNISIAEICEDIVDLYEYMAKKKNIIINIDIEKTTKTIADQHMISTIIRNLLSNAIKFSQPDTEINIVAVSETDHLKISIIDYGIGMSVEILNQLFEISYNPSTLGTNNEKGSGLGLILCREFVHKHQGQIWAESTEGRGSKFHFTIPFHIE